MLSRRKFQKFQDEQRKKQASEDLEKRQNLNKGKEGPPMARETEAPKGKQGKTIDLGKKKGQRKSGNSGNQEHRRAA